jgi:hypothetical protein
VDEDEAEPMSDNDKGSGSLRTVDKGYAWSYREGKASCRGSERDRVDGRERV